MLLFFFFIHSFRLIVPLSLSLSYSLSSHLWSSSLLSSLFQLWSLKLPHSPLPARLILNVTTTEARRHRPTSRPKLPISLRPTPSIGVLARGCACSWILGTWLGNPWSSPSHPFCRPSSLTLCLFVISDFLFCLWLVIFFGLGWGKRLEIWVFFFILFFPTVDWWWQWWYWWWLWLWLWLWLMVEVVVVGAVDVFWVVGYIILL